MGGYPADTVRNHRGCWDIDEWWKNTGVRAPVYVGGAKGGRGKDVGLGIVILTSILGELTGFLPRGFSILVTTIGFLAEFISSILGLNRKSLDAREKKYLGELLKTVAGRLGYWSVPCPRIPLTAMLRGGYYLVIYRRRKELYAVMIKPVLTQKVRECRCVFKIGKVKDNLYRIILPNPYVRGYCYTIIGRMAVSPLIVEPKTLLGKLEGAVGS